MSAESIFERGGRIGLAALAVGLLVAAPRAQDKGGEEARAQAKANENCIRVELMMYSGRPRPHYLVCGDDEKEDAIRKLQSATEGQAASPVEPLESTPAYQGLLIIAPKNERRVARHSFVGKGKVDNLDAKSAFRTDANRDLEAYFLDLAATRKDLSMPGREEPLQPLVSGLKAKLKEGK